MDKISYSFFSPFPFLSFLFFSSPPFLSLFLFFTFLPLFERDKRAEAF